MQNTDFKQQLPPLSLYIHLPWCIKKCPYCDFNSYATNADTNSDINSDTNPDTNPNGSKNTAIPEAAYIDALTRDLKQELPNVQNRTIDTLFFGGGTPSLFSPKAIEQIIALCQQYLTFSDSIEITLEANPESSLRYSMKDFCLAGVNRISLGVQSFNNQHLHSLGRVHSNQQTYRALEQIAAANFKSFNLDLMYALPGQSLEDALEDLKIALSFNPPHLSWYQLTLEPNTVFHHKPPILPNEDIVFLMMEKGQTLLQEHGLKQYEVSAYAKQNHEAKHNLNYWTFGDYLGIGAGAHGKITRVTNASINSEDPKLKVIRTQKTRYPKSYMDMLLPMQTEPKTIPESDLPLEFMLNALRLTEGFSLSLFENRTGLTIKSIEKAIAKGVELELLMIKENYLIPTALGKRFLNNVVNLF